MTMAETELRKAIKQLKNGKSGGPDMLLNEFFIHGVNELLHYLYNLFIKYWSSVIFQRFGVRDT